MKNTVTIAFFLLYTLAVAAQPSRGSFLADANFSFSRSATDYFYTNGNVPTSHEHTTEWSLNPSVGYFVLDRLCLGASTPYQHISYKTSGDPASHFHSIGIGPFIRYYQPFGKGFYGVGNASYSWARTVENILISDPFLNPDETIKTTSKLISVGVGVSYFVKQSIAISLMTNYVEQTDSSPDKTHQFITTLGTQIYFLRKKS